ncbi:MAG TPA: thioredoxin family protein [Dongiaceae bacterium]|nr:thioredoxin family protein [Dongiaceae bacterium]
MSAGNRWRAAAVVILVAGVAGVSSLRADCGMGASAAKPVSGAAAASSAAVVPASAGGLALGSTAPERDVKMKSVDEKEYSIASVAGEKGTLVIFTCNHCPWVKRWQGRITAIGNAAGARGVGVIAINSNDPEQFPEDAFGEMVSRAKQLGLRFPYVMDATSDVGRAFGVTHTPEAFLFDADGKLVYHGGVDDNAQDERAVGHAWLHDAVDAVATGKTVPTAETKTLGCSIKLRPAATQ